MNSRIFRAALLCLLIAGSLAACEVQSYDDAVAGLGTPTPTPSPQPPPPGGFGPNFSEIQTAVLTPTCTGSCHVGGAPSGGLNLEAANSYVALVGITSNGDAGFMRVEAFDANNSYLVRKLEGNAGGIMPPTGMLPQADIDVIRTWIDNGAIDDTAVPPTPIRVNTISPMPGATLTPANAPAQIVAGFDRNPDPATVDGNSFTLTASGGDGSFGEANDMQIVPLVPPSVPGANPGTAIFDLTGIALGDDTYRITLSGSTPSMIMDMDGNALDGEYQPGVFPPSGDGTAGGDFVVQFVIDTPTLAQIQAATFTPRCASCHSGATPRGGLDLSSTAASAANLIGIASVGDPLIPRVDPTNPNGSYLIMKLEGNAGGIMPPTGMLPSADIAFIREWIQLGAAP